MSIALQADPADRPVEKPAPSTLRVAIDGKFLRIGDDRFLVKGVTYGTFAPDAQGYQFPPLQQVAADFRQMAGLGINTVRTYTPPRREMLDAAAAEGLRVMVGLPWSQHVAFLDERSLKKTIRRELVEKVTELGDLAGDLMANLPLQRAIVEEGDMLRPWQPDHDAQPFSCRNVEQIAARRRVSTDCVDAEARHLAEVRGDLMKRRELIALRVGRKRPVGHTFDQEAIVADAQEFSVRGDALGGHRPSLAMDFRISLNCSAHNRIKPLYGQILLYPESTVDPDAAAEGFEAELALAAAAQVRPDRSAAGAVQRERHLRVQTAAE